MVGPSGPRRLRLAVEHLAQHRGGICFMVDLDPRWVIKLIKARQMEQVEAYKRHVVDQALTLLRAHDNIKCLFTTPKLLEALCEKMSLRKMGVTGVFCGGTEMTPQFHRFARRRAARRRRLRADLRQHADGPGDPQAAGPGGQLRDHLLPAGAAGDDRGRRSRRSGRGRRLRRDRPGAPDDADAGSSSCPASWSATRRSASRPATSTRGMASATSARSPASRRRWWRGSIRDPGPVRVTGASGPAPSAAASAETERPLR